ncbi:hypothetical protein WJX77_011139 [Trebouxia sp. C0004]
MCGLPAVLQPGENKSSRYHRDCAVIPEVKGLPHGCEIPLPKRQVLHDGSFADSPELRLLSEGGAWRKWENCQTLPAGNLKVKVISQQPGDGQPTTKVIQDLRDEMRLLRSDFAARYTEAKSIAFSLVSGAAANQLLEDLHLTEADGFEEAPFETPADKATFRMNHPDVLQAEVAAPRQYSFKEGCTPTQAYHEMADFLIRQGPMLTSKHTILEPPAELEEELRRPIKKLKGLVQGYSAV